MLAFTGRNTGHNTKHPSTLTFHCKHKRDFCWLCSSPLARIKKPFLAMLQQRFDQTPAVNHVYGPAHTHSILLRKARVCCTSEISLQVQDKSEKHGRRNTRCLITIMFGENAAVSSLSNEVHVWELTNREVSVLLGCSLRGYGCNQSL